MKPNVQFKMGQYVKNVVQMILTTIQILVKIQKNVLVVEEIMYQYQTNVKFG